MSKKISHTREVPPEWSDLVAYAKTIVMSTDEKARLWPFFKLCKRVSRLGDAELFSNYYFGLGEVMTVMSGMLEVEETRAQIVNTTARLMVKGALEKRLPSIEVNEPFMPVMYDLNPSNLWDPFIDLAGQAMPKLSVPEQSLINAFDYVSDYRRHVSVNDIKGKLVSPILFEDSRRGFSIPEHIGTNALIGATKVVFNRVLGISEKDYTQEELLTPLTLDLVNTVFDPRPFIGAANERLDEFHEDRGWKEVDGEWHFDWGYLKTPPLAPVKNDKFPVFHEERFGCPALYAGRLVREVAVNIFPEIIRTAHTIIPASVA